MAVIPEYPWKDKNGIEHSELIRHFSDQGKKLIQVDTGILYDDAVDPYPTEHSYIESDEDVPDYPDL